MCNIFKIGVQAIFLLLYYSATVGMNVAFYFYSDKGKET